MTKINKNVREQVLNDTHYRDLKFSRANIDEENRTVELSFSSELPYERWFGMEILDHDERSVDLKRLRAGGAVLVDHDSRDQVGVVEEVVISSERKGRARVRFGKSQRANEIFQDVLDEIRTSVSVGYEIREMTLEGKEGDKDVYRVNSWSPFEISIVSIPADTSVGTNRQQTQLNKPIKETEMSQDTQNAPAAPTVDVKAVETQARADERKEYQKQVRDLISTGEQFGAQDLAKRAIEEGHSVDQLRQAILESRSNETPIQAESPEVGLTEKETRNYSMTKLINALANPNDANAQRAASFEFEVSSAAANKLKKESRGAMVPYEVLKRDLNVGTAADGGNLVETSLLSGSFIDSLENALALRQCGATMLTGLNGNIAIPRQNGGASHFWLAENGEPTESSASFDQIGMKPKTVGAFTEISRKLLLQSSISMEGFVQNELALRIALAIDAAGIFGTGASNQPRGLLNYSGVGSVAGGTNGGAIDWAKVVDLETETGTANALVQNMCYLTNAKVRGSAKQTLKAAGVSGYIWEDNMMNGFPVVTSNQVPGNLSKGTGSDLSALAFGNFADLIIGMWGGLDLQVNPYSLDTKGAVRVTAFQDVDIELRHPESFAVMKDVITG